MSCTNRARAFLLVFAASLSPWFTQMVCAQVANDSELFIQLQQADSLIFKEGFNKCNFPALETVMHAELEFFHDQSGILDREKFFEASRKNLCSDPDHKPIRKLVDGSLVVYPLKNEGNLYGAIQMGTHEFYMAEPDKELRFTGIARFIHTWVLVGGQWKLYRVLSYDHQ